MIRKMRMLLGRPRGGRAQMDAETTDRLVSVVLERESAHIPDPANESVDPDALEVLRMITAIHQVGASDSPLPKSRVGTIMVGLQHEVEGGSLSGVWRTRLGMVVGFLVCTVTLGSGLLLLGGTPVLQPPVTGAAATPALALAVASVAALVSLLLHRGSKLRSPALPLLAIGALTAGSCSPGSPDLSQVEVPSTALITFHQGEELWGVRDIIESGKVIWVLTESPPFLRAYHRGGHMLADFGTSGAGPGEFRNPWTLSAATPAGNVIVWDYGARTRFVFDAAGNFAASTPAPITPKGIRNDIRSVTFGDPFRVAADDNGLWVASYPGGIARADDFWNGRILLITNGEAEPRVLVDFAADLPGAASRIPSMGLDPVPVWDRCPDGSVAVLDPVDRSLHLYAPGGSEGQRRIPLPWTGQPFSHEERLAYLRATIRVETKGSNISDAEIHRAADDVLARAGDQMSTEAPIGVDVRCSADRVWIQEFDGSSHPLGYGKVWRTFSLGEGTPHFQRVVFPEGFAAYRLSDSLAVGVVTDSTDLQRVAVVRLVGVLP